MAEGVLQFNVASMVEDVLLQHEKRLCDIDVASRKAQEASLRRNEATGWLRKMVGVVLGKDLPAEPSEEALRIGLRSGIILCNVLNKVQPGSVSKVVETPSDTVIIPDGAVLNAYQYFENLRNFLVAIEQMGIPSFEVSDLEQGGKSSRVVNCILALKSYYEWKQSGVNGQWRFGGYSSRPAPIGKPIVRKSADQFLKFLLKNSSVGEGTLSDENSTGDVVQGLNEMGISPSLQRLVRDLLSDKNVEDIPVIVENMLNKVMEEYERRLQSQKENVSTTSQHKSVHNSCTTRDMEIRTTQLNKDASSSYTTGKTEDIKRNEKQELIKATFQDDGDSDSYVTLNTEIKTSSQDKDVPGLYTAANIETPNIKKYEGRPEKDACVEAAQALPLKYQQYVEAASALSLKYQNSAEHQQRSVQELKNTLHSTKEDMQMLQIKYQEDVNRLGKHISHLASAAAGYQKVLEENRKLYNQVQDLKGNIRVYCRVRPFLPGQRNGLSALDDIVDSSLTIQTNVKHGKGKKTFTFNKAFGPASTQEEVFADTQPLIRSVLDGYNVCIFAYGQTGSGKTFTMTGPKELTKETLGVNYRALSDLFQISEQRKDTIAYDISVQMMEIYNEQVRDLLITDGVQKKLEIRNNSPDGINVPNANLVPVTSTSDVINLMNLGHKNRAVGSTSMNDRSSRSHSCLTVHVRGRELTSGTHIRGCMHLVDLAGSERADKTDAVGDRLKEAQHINKSLSALGDVISALAQKNAHVPYRNSKLTQLLQDSLGGQAKTLMFVHISPEPDALGETLSTLKFAERVSTIELGAAKSNKDNTSADVKELKEQIAALKAALARKDAGDLVSCGSSPSYSSYSKAEEQSNASSRRHSLDSQDLLMNSPPWPMEEEKPLSNQHGGGGRESPEIFYKKGNRDSMKVKPAEQGLNKKGTSTPRRHSLDNPLPTPNQCQTTTDDSEDVDAATSDSSDPESRWQLNIPKVNSSPNVVGSKLKKPTPKPTKAQEMRSQIPQPTGRVSNGVHSSLNKNGRQAAASSVAGRRKPASGK